MIEVFDYITGRVLFIELTTEMEKSIKDEYENDLEAWMSDKEIDKQFDFDLSNSNWMQTDGMPPLLFCKAENGETVDAHLYP